jgi:tetratricopeptide (TPR) repeat protein
VKDPSSWFCLLLFIGAALLIVILNDRHKAYLVHKAERKGIEPKPAWRNYRTSRYVYISLFLTSILLLLIYQFRNVWISLSVVLGGIVLVATVSAWRKRLPLSAIRLAQAGDLDGATLEIRRLIERKGPSVERLNMLGLLLGLQQKWDESLDAFAEMARLGGDAPKFSASIGWVLWKMGRWQEALPLMEEGLQWSPNNLHITCNYCLLLADLGRFEEARVQVDHAERLLRSQFVFRARARRQRRELLEECRRKL